MPERFPSIDAIGEPSNPAIQLYGRRFYKDQTPVEYLAEFLLVFASPKGSAGKDGQADAFSFTIGDDESRGSYWPQDRIALKLFAFFPTSKQETRHDVHRTTYRQGLDDLKKRMTGSDQEKDDTIRLLQSLFSGFVGVAKNRTWVTYSFLPASTAFLAREVTWNHPAALKNPRKVDISTWMGLTAYFDSSTHNFLGRGGELLFLQLAYLFSRHAKSSVADLLPGKAYDHLNALRIADIRSVIESDLVEILSGSIEAAGGIASFVESALQAVRLPYEKRGATQLGWVPTSVAPEAFLFAVEMQNICRSTVGSLEKLDLLQVLCVMHVLRSLCFQGSRVDENSGTTTFGGHYAWICADPSAAPGTAMRRLSQSSFDHVEGLLFRALRSPMLNTSGPPSAGDLKNGDDNCFRMFRKFGKDLGLVVPRTGKGQRFVLPPHLVRFLVAAVVTPGEQILLTEFYARVFAHYGIALADRQLAVALEWGGAQTGDRDYAVAADTRWIEEALHQGGFLVELSDAVSIVRNPGGTVAVAPNSRMAYP